MSARGPQESVEQSDEVVVADVFLQDVRFTVTDRRVVVVTDYRMALDLPHADLRRIQFDIERDRPATIVIVPDRASAEPVVLAVPAHALEIVSRALGFIGQHLGDGIDGGGPAERQHPTTPGRDGADPPGRGRLPT